MVDWRSWLARFLDMEEVTGSSPVSTTITHETEVMAMDTSTLLDLNTFSVDELADFYRAPQSTWVRSNMAISLDGHYVDETGSSRGLSSSLDVTILLLLRALSDVVVVGGYTARQEAYAPKLPRREFAHLSPVPPRLCVLSKSLDFDVNDAMFRQDISSPIIITTQSPDAMWEDRVAALSGVSQVVVVSEMTGRSVINVLTDMKLQSVVSEGGPYVQQLLRADQVINELDVTIAPVISGTSSGTSPFGSIAGKLSPHAIARGNDHIYARFFVES